MRHAEQRRSRRLRGCVRRRDERQLDGRARIDPLGHARRPSRLSSGRRRLIYRARMEESAGLSPPASEATGESPAGDFSGAPRAGKVRTRVRIGQAWIDALTFDEAVLEIERLIETGKGGSVFTPNVDHLVQLEREENAPFREAYDDASLCLVDGQPLLWASHLLGSPLPEKVSGSDLIVPLVARAEKKR